MMLMATKKNLTPPKDFEDALRELEQILADIEKGEVGLEESLLRYERGTFLIQHCQNILNTAEKQIELITRNQNGELKTTPLPEDEETA
jgi:exodeoxyribonuclease VII small subunit